MATLRHRSRSICSVTIHIQSPPHPIEWQRSSALSVRILWPKRDFKMANVCPSFLFMWFPSFSVFYIPYGMLLLAGRYHGLGLAAVLPFRHEHETCSYRISTQTHAHIRRRGRKARWFVYVTRWRACECKRFFSHLYVSFQSRVQVFSYISTFKHILAGSSNVAIIIITIK